MKEQTIAKMVKAGVGQDRAEKFYALFLSAMCGGIEPEAGDTFTREDIAAAFPGNVPARNALTAALCGEQKEAPKPTALKEKHRATLDTAVLLAEMIKGGALWVTEELLDRATRKNAGLSSPCLFLKDGGGVYEAESAQWIEWIRKGVPLGDGMDIDGKFRKPVRIGEERPAEKFTRDPFGSGPLTMPGTMSVCGASLDGVTEEAVSFLVLVYQHEQLSPAEQRKACALAKGGLAGLLAEYPLAKRKWDGGSRPEPTVGAEQIRNPPVAGGDVAVSVGPIFAASPAANAPVPLVVILGHETKAYASVRQALVPLQQAGILRMWSEKDLRAGEFVSESVRKAHAEAALFIALIDTYSLASLREVLSALIEAKRPVMPVIVGSCLWDMTDVARLSVLFPKQPYGTHESDNTTLAREVRSNLLAITNRNALAGNVRPARLDINEVAAAIINGGLARSRGALLAGLPPAVVAGLSDAGSPSDQVYQDLGALQNMGQILDGSRPLAKYLRSAAMLAGPRCEAQVFRDALRALENSGPAWTGVAPFPFSNPEAVRWLAAATEAYSPERAKNICQVAGISTGNVYFQQGARGLWTSIAESAANQGKLRALFDYTVRDDSAAAIFREWRS